MVIIINPHSPFDLVGHGDSNRSAHSFDPSESTNQKEEKSKDRRWVMIIIVGHLFTEEKKRIEEERKERRKGNVS